MTIAQSEDTCVVEWDAARGYHKGYANKIVPLDSIGAFLVSQYGGDRAPCQRNPRNPRK